MGEQLADGTDFRSKLKLSTISEQELSNLG